MGGHQTTNPENIGFFNLIENASDLKVTLGGSVLNSLRTIQVRF